MILYCDSSALVKLWVRERGSADVRRGVARADAVAVSSVGYPEIRAAFARRHREGKMSVRAMRRAVRAVDADWPHYLVLDVDTQIARRAGGIAETHALRGFDAIHLATALEVTTQLGVPVAFVAYDRRLSIAASAEGLTVI